jgi:hypothetical protein
LLSSKAALFAGFTGQKEPGRPHGRMAVCSVFLIPRRLAAPAAGGIQKASGRRGRGAGHCALLIIAQLLLLASNFLRLGSKTQSPAAVPPRLDFAERQTPAPAST